ncbi:MAG: response regulator [Catenulisporales bacterium]|jgi:CheY-like chemotaxis protein|nr:response regulator [Catenulisporales bacterium]
MADHSDSRCDTTSGAPRGRSDGPAGATKPKQPAQPAFEGQRVLIVDDDARGVYALSSALAVRGLSVVYAATGLDGIEAVRRDPTIRAVLLEVALPGLDGYATAARIRELERGGDTPIVAVTFEASAADRAKCLAAGMDVHVPKPVDVGHLLRVLRTLIP